MYPVKFSRPRIGVQAIETILDRLMSFFRPIEINPLVDGRLHSVSITGGANSTVYHGLGRIPTGWVLLDNDANTVPYKVSSDSDTIVLTAANTCNIVIWVV